MASNQPLHCAAVDLGATSGRVILGTWGEKQAHPARGPTVFPTASARSGRTITGMSPASGWRSRPGPSQGRRAALPRGAKLASVGVDTLGRRLRPAQRRSAAWCSPRTPTATAACSRSSINSPAPPAALERIYAATGIPQRLLQLVAATRRDPSRASQP